MTTVIATAVQPLTVNAANGTSFRFDYNPTGTVSQTITEFSGQKASGAKISVVVDNLDGTSAVYAYNPSGTVRQTTQT